MPDIINKYAKNSEGDYISAGEAPKGQKYWCPNCGQEFTLKKSERRKKRPHFAHKIDTGGCTSEQILHKTFQELLFSKIKSRLDDNAPLEIIWKCSYCHEDHGGNLLKNICDAEMEYNLKECIPDIALLNKSNKVFAVIEIVVTHAPEDYALKYYKLNNIILIQYILKSDSDVDRLNEFALKPDAVDICFNPKCKRCGKHMNKQNLHIISGDCWKCKRPMKMALLADGSRLICGPEGFNPKEIVLSRKNGVKIERRYSQTVEESYLANVCEYCNAFRGKHFLLDCFILAQDGSYRYEILDAGYYCDYCL